MKGAKIWTRYKDEHGVWKGAPTEADPLGALNLERTKTQVPRRVPVHQTLARILRGWREGGWERIYGRPPADDDSCYRSAKLAESLAKKLQTPTPQELRPQRGHSPI